MTNKNEETKLDWSRPGSVKIPASIVKAIDDFKEKNDYSSRGQAIVAMIKIAEQRDLVQNMFEKEREKIVNEILQQLGSRFSGKT